MWPDDCLTRVGDVGRAGYCFHQNAALELALRGLGFSTTRRHGHAWNDPEARWTGELDHLVIVVEGLPTADNPGGRWWPDVGLGDGFRDPLPLVVGDYCQGPFTYRITEVRDDGWSFEHDPSSSVAGIEVTSEAVDQVAIERVHAGLTTAPTGRFTRRVVVERRNADSADILRGCLWTHVDGTGAHPVELSTHDEWRTVITETLGLSLDDIAEEGLRDLYADQWGQHERWTAEGRP